MPGVMWVSFIMDKASAPACKVYHGHCKEVKDWVMFAGKVATTAGPALFHAIVVDVECWEGRLHYRNRRLGRGSRCADHLPC